MSVRLSLLECLEVEWVCRIQGNKGEAPLFLLERRPCHLCKVGRGLNDSSVFASGFGFDI